jgi:hypothetical protein
MTVCHQDDPRAAASRSDAGFTMLELLMTTLLMLIVTGAVTTALTQLTKGELIVWNRTEMHSSVRGATELLQQEVGQAGLVTLPTNVTLTTVVIDSSTTSAGVTSTNGMFVGEKLTVGTEDTQETVTITAINTTTKTISGVFKASHPIGAPVTVLGGFVTGIVPPNATNGSTGSVLKLYGDINGDQNMVYVEYTCDTTARKLYRNVMAWNASSKPAKTDAMVLLTNVVANPNNTPCFTYQTALASGVTFVTDVAITLTVRTQLVDPITKEYQTESKALLNVSPRNVYNVWQLASLGSLDRSQPMPSNVATNLLP